MRNTHRDSKREADHLSKDRLVLVPANPSARGVLGQENLLQVGGSKPGERGRAFAQAQQRTRGMSSVSGFACVEVVLPPEGDDPALAQVALELESLKRQGSKLATSSRSSWLRSGPFGT